MFNSTIQSKMISDCDFFFPGYLCKLILWYHPICRDRRSYLLTFNVPAVELNSGLSRSEREMKWADPGHRFDHRGKLKELRRCTESEITTIPSCVPRPGPGTTTGIIAGKTCGWNNSSRQNSETKEAKCFVDVSGALEQRITGSSPPGNLWSKVACWSHLTWQSSESQLIYLLTESSRNILVKTSTWILHSTAPTQRLHRSVLGTWTAPVMLPCYY